MDKICKIDDKICKIGDKIGDKINKIIYINMDNRTDRKSALLHLFSFKTPTSWAVMSEKGGPLCAF